MNIIKHTIEYVSAYGFKTTLRRAGEKAYEHFFKRYHRWAQKQAPTEAELASQRAHVFCDPPLISIVVPVYNTKSVFLQELVESVLAQTYPHFELCLLDGNSQRPETLELLTALPNKDPRIRVKHSRENLGISGNTNLAIAFATGDYIALLDHDDLLTPDALYHVACAIQSQGADFIYTDEDKISEKSHYTFDPHFKADFSPDELRSSNYICHLMVIKKTLIESAGMLNPAFDGSQDHDLALRVSEKAAKIVHIPRVLYHWRQLQSSMSHQNNDKCIGAAKRTVSAQLARLNISGDVTIEGARVHVHYRITGNPTVTFIIAHRGSDARLKRCLDSLPDYDYLVTPGGYKALNDAAKQSQSDILIFIDSGMRLKKGSDLSSMIGRAQLADAGIVAPLITYKNNTLRHQGYLVGMKNVVANAQQHLPLSTWGYFAKAHVSHNISAASCAFFAVRRDVFMANGLFEESYEQDLADVAFCLRLVSKGLFNVSLPDVKAVYEKSEFGPDAIIDTLPNERDAARFLEAHGILEDPFYNPNLTRENGSYRLRQI